MTAVCHHPAPALLGRVSVRLGEEETARLHRRKSPSPPHAQGRQRSLRSSRTRLFSRAANVFPAFTGFATPRALKSRFIAAAKSP